MSTGTPTSLSFVFVADGAFSLRLTSTSYCLFLLAYTVRSVP
jgi:hypothetical protein